MTKKTNSYYDGGARVILGGVPCRVARKPSPNALKQLQQTARGFSVGVRQIDHAAVEKARQDYLAS